MDTPSILPVTRCIKPPGRFPSFLAQTLAALALASVSSSLAGTVAFDGNGTGATVLSTAANWDTNALPTTTDRATFTDAAFGAALPSALTNGSAQTWGNLTWNSNSSSSISGSALTLSGGAGTSDIITLGSLMTSGTLTYGVTNISTFITATNGAINVVNAGATLNFTSQFEFNNTIPNQVITKSGAGTLNFSNGNNGNAGAGAGAKFVLDGGTLNFSTNTGFGSFGAANVVLEIHNGTFLDTAGAGFDTTLSKNNAEIWAGDFTFKGTSKNLNLGTGAVTLTGGSRQVTVNALTLTAAGIIGDGGNGYGLTKAGAGTLSLTAANTYTGITTVNSGTLRLLFNAAGTPASNIINSSSALRLAGGALLISGTASATNSQTFNGLTVAAGSSIFNATIGAGGTVNASLGAITRNTGGVLNFVLPTSGAISTSSSNDANGLLGPGMTVGNLDWATVSAGNVAAFTGYTSANAVGTWASNQNITTTAAVSGSLAANLTLNSLRLNPNNVAANVNLGGKTLTILDGILVTGSAGQTQTISNGTLQGSAGGDLVLINSSGAGAGLTISANIVDNSTATALTSSGPSNKTTTLSGTNSYTGATYINSGTLAAGIVNTAFGNNSAVVISTNAAMNITGFNQTIGSLASNNPTSLGLVTLGAATLTSGGDNTSTVFNGTIGGTGGFTKVGTGTQTFAGVGTYTGATTVSAGTLLLRATSNNIASSGTITVNNATLDVSNISSGFALASGQTLAGSGTIDGALTVASGATLAIGNSPGTMTFNNDLTLAAGSTGNFEINGLTSGLYDLAQGGSGVQAVAFAGTLNLLFQAGFNTLGTVKIFDFENYSGNFTTVNTSGLAGGYSATFDQLTGVVTVVPEPSTYALLGAGLSMLWVLRRKLRAA